jgi:hypothetical protein
MDIKYGHRTEEELKQIGRTRVLDTKSVVFGVSIFLFLAISASLWRFHFKEGSLKKLREFEFTPQEPETEEFELKEPLRELLEQQLEKPEMMEETPTIQMTPEITESEVQEEVIKTEQIEMTTDMELKVTEMDIIEAPEDLDAIADDTTYAMTPIATMVDGPGDYLKQDRPTPRHRPMVSLLNKATRPSIGLKLSPRQFGDLDAPTVGELGPVGINLLGSGEYLSAMGRSGGLETRTAVDAALRWLALHQEPDGSWIPHKWDAEDCSLTRPEASVVKGGRGDQHATGITGLAVLAFMGGGHTIRKGEYRMNLMRALNYILKGQDRKTGQLSKNMYEHSICTIALCEAFGRAPDERVGTAARRAVDFCVKAVGTDCGWRYTPNPEQSDMSVSGWFLQALKTAKLSNIKFEHKVFSQGLTFVDQLTDRGGMKGSNGGVGYTYQANLNYGNGHPALTCAGMVIRQFSGMGVKSRLLVAGAELTKKKEPKWEDKDFYYWYYATYAMHNMGGEYRIWWNRRIRDVLLDNQSKRGHQSGSWNPEDAKWNAGRVYCTSLGALCLEVYYRYGEALQSFGTAPDLEDLFFQ